MDTYTCINDELVNFYNYNTDNNYYYPLKLNEEYQGNLI